MLRPTLVADAAAQVDPARQVLATLLGDGEVQSYLQVNRYDDVLWYNQESFVELMQGLLLTGIVVAAPAPESDLTAMVATIDELLAADAESDYQVEKLLAYGDVDAFSEDVAED